MTNAERLAREYGVPVEFADLGEWGGGAELRSEYDPAGPVIRINTRAVAAHGNAIVALAIGHELYHHREHLGEIPKLPSRAMREAAADAFARTLAGAP